MQVSSTAFENGETIPEMFTCDGKNISPHVIIGETPANTQSLVLIMEDPDAPSGVFTHWVLWNLPVGTQDIPEGGFVEGSVEGMNSGAKQGYLGPCPPDGTHRYFFNVYALDVTLELSATSGREDLEAEMGGHIIDQGKLMGLYSR